MIRRTLALTGVLGAFACANAAAAPVTVDLRVEGATQTMFEGPVTTDGHRIDGHPCDGTNGGNYPTPGPTMFGALDSSGLTWGRTWDDGFQDFFLNSIGPDSNAQDFSTSWGYFLDGRDPGRGGCQQQVANGAQVLFAYGAYGRPLLRLSSARRAAVGEAVAVLVEEIDGSSGQASPSAGAQVHGAATGADGRAAPVFGSPGSYTFKATKDGTVRSNSATVCVYDPAAGGCGLDAPGDDVPPSASLTGLVDGRTYRRPPRTLRGRVEDDGAIHQVYLKVRMIDRRGCRWLSGRSERFTRPRSCDRARYIRVGNDTEWSYLLPFSLPGGARYIVDVKVLDAALNRATEQVRFRVAR